MKRVVAVNERGLRIGEDHRLAKLTNVEIEMVLALRDEGWSYRRLAVKFEISKSAARMYCKGLRRCQSPAGWRTVEVHVVD